MIYIEAHDDVEADRLLLDVGVKAVHLKRPLVRHDYLHDVVTDKGRFIIRSIVRINADSGHYDSRLFVHTHLDPSRQLVDFVDRHSVGQLEVDRSVLLSGAVVVEHQVVSAQYLRLFIEDVLDLLRKIRIGPSSDDVAESFLHHIDTGLDDDS